MESGYFLILNFKFENLKDREKETLKTFFPFATVTFLKFGVALKILCGGAHLHLVYCISRMYMDQ